MALLDIENTMKKIIIICLVLFVTLFVCVLVLSNKKVDINELKTNMLQTKQFVVKKAKQNTDEYVIKTKENDNQKILNIISLLKEIECDSPNKPNPAMEIQPKYLLLMYDSKNNEIAKFSINSKEIKLVGECYLKINNDDFTKLYSEIEKMSD